MFICPKCSKQYEEVNGLLSHCVRTHKINSKDLYNEINSIKENPKCICGCGEEVDFHTFTTGYYKCIRGHQPKIGFTVESRAKAQQTYRDNLASGKTVRKKKEKVFDSSKEFKCVMCPQSFDTPLSLAHHGTRGHKLTSKDFYLRYHNLLEEPKCGCGCGEITTYLDFSRGYREYILGHVARINNNYQTEKSINNSINTRREMIRNGEWKPFFENETGEHWSKGLTAETDERVAKMVNSILSNEEEIKRRSIRMKEGRFDGTIPTIFGPNHSQWKGGISPLQHTCRNNTKLHNEWKFPKLKTSNFSCEKCGIKNSRLEVHHNGESFSLILRKIAEQNNWEHNLATATSPDDEVLFQLKQKISNEVAEYHILNNILGIVLCKECHKEEHRINNIIDED